MTGFLRSAAAIWSAPDAATTWSDRVLDPTRPSPDPALTDYLGPGAAMRCGADAVPT
jgi:hypothetical protein